MNAKTNAKLMRRIIGLILTGLLLTSLLILGGTTAGAQTRTQRPTVVVPPIRRPPRPFHRYDPFWRQDRFDYHRYRQYVFSSSEKAYNQGYKDGLKTGDNDGRKGKSYDPERSHYFHDAGFGNYAEAYRDGFSRGYREGYST
jgi:hypothetical protein